MFSLLFSPKGRIKRLPFLGAYIGSILLMVLVITVAVYTSLPPGIDQTTITTENAFQIVRDLIFAAIVTLVTLILYLWSQVCIVLKRSRDFSGSSLFAVFYFVVMFSPFFILLASLDLVFVVETVAPIANGLMFIMFLVLLFVPSKAGQYEEQTAEVFGEGSGPSFSQDASIGISSDTDLIARAAQLREAEQARAAASQSARPAGRRTANGGFGQRTNTPAFGNR